MKEKVQREKLGQINMEMDRCKKIGYLNSYKKQHLKPFDRTQVSYSRLIFREWIHRTLTRVIYVKSRRKFLSTWSRSATPSQARKWPCFLQTPKENSSRVSNHMILVMNWYHHFLELFVQEINHLGYWKSDVQHNIVESKCLLHQYLLIQDTEIGLTSYGIDPH